MAEALRVATAADMPCPGIPAWTSEPDDNPEHLAEPHGADALERLRARLTAFYWAHDPRKVDHVDEILAQHQGEEEQFLQRVHRDFGVRDFSSEEAVDDIYEHQRYSYLSFSWGATFPGHLLPTDRHCWSGLHGSPSSQTREKVEPQLPVNWRWTSDWTVDTTSCNCDADGWVYAMDFPMINYLIKKGQERSVPNTTDYVRRRRWIRTRRRVPESVPTAPSSLSKIMESTATSSSNQRVANETQPVGSSYENGIATAAVEEGGQSDAEGWNKLPESSGDVGVADSDAASRLNSAEAEARTPPQSTSPQAKTSVPPTPVQLQLFPLTMDKPAIEMAWKAAVKDLEQVYTRGREQKLKTKKTWGVKKEKIRRQIHLLEKTIVSMQAVAAEEEKKRRLGMSSTQSSPGSRSPKAAGAAPSSGPLPLNVGLDSPSNALSLAAKMRCAQSKLDALRRFYWHPRENEYTLRFSIDGIFYGLRDFFVETFKSSFSIQVSHQTNGTQGITPICKIHMKGHTVCCGKHVKVVGEKGTRVPKSLWDSMYLDTDFEASINLIYVEDPQDSSSTAMGNWEFLVAPEATNVELTNFTRRVKGGMDLPEGVVRKLCSDVLSALVRDLTLLYFPSELALAFDLPPGKVDLQGEMEITGQPIDDVMEKELQEMDVSPVREEQAGEKLHKEADRTKDVEKEESPEVPPASNSLLGAAAVAAQVFSLAPIRADKEMQAIAEQLQLSPAQLNLLVALKASPLFPTTHNFRSVASICSYYKAFSTVEDSVEAAENEDRQNQDERLRATWKRLVELVYIRKKQAAEAANAQRAKSTRSGVARASQVELFDVDAFFDTIARLVKKPATVRLTMTHFYFTLNALNAVEALSKLYERVVLGIDFNKPRAGANEFLYGFRFGRKSSLPLTIATAAVAAAATVAATNSSSESPPASPPPVIDPRRYRPLEKSFRTRVKTFSKFWHSLRAVIKFVRQNVDDVSAELAGSVRGTGDDCELNGSFKDAEYRGPLNMALAVPPCFLGFYRAEMIALGSNRVGMQMDVMLPPDATQSSPTKPLESVARAMLADLTSEVLIDLDGLLAQREESAVELLASSKKASSPITSRNPPNQHRALSFSFNATPTTGEKSESEVASLSTDDTTQSRATGQLHVATSAFTKLHTAAKTGSFQARVLPLLEWLLTSYIRPQVAKSFPQYQVLFDTVQAGVMQWLRSTHLEMDFDVLARAFIHDDESLMVTLCGSPLHPTPMTFKDDVNLLDLILQVDDLANIWIDDRYPPYSNPLYF